MVKGASWGLSINEEIFVVIINRTYVLVKGIAWFGMSKYVFQPFYCEPFVPQDNPREVISHSKQ